MSEKEELEHPTRTVYGIDTGRVYISAYRNEQTDIDTAHVLIHVFDDTGDAAVYFDPNTLLGLIETLQDALEEARQIILSD